MEILYIAGMAAVFVLCLALLSTARRILKPSPLSAGSLALMHLQNAIDSTNADVELDFADSTTLARPIELAEPVSISETLVLSSNSASEAPFVESVTPMEEAPEMKLPESVYPASVDTPQQPVSPRVPREQKQGASLFPAYNHVLECLLLGVSLVVLVQTQRSTSRFRSLQSSDQVA